MKKQFYFLLLSICLALPDAKAQLPNVPYTDYSTKKGVITDARDGKTYAYKKYGSYDWFMQNLNWDGYDGTTESTRGSVGVYGTVDPTGEKFGRMYPTNITNTNMNKWCPSGWTVATKSDWEKLYTNIVKLYGITDVALNADSTSVVISSNSVENMAKYLKTGGLVSDGGLWTSGTIDPLSSQIGINILPAGVFNKTTGYYTKGTNSSATDTVGKKASFLVGSYFHEYFLNNSEYALYTNRNSQHHASVRCIRKSETTFPDIEITTPYPDTVVINQIVSTEKEIKRLRQVQKKFDHSLTGFYIESGKQVAVNVEVLNPASDDASPKIVIGTPSRSGNIRKEITLNPGLNIITPDMHTGGMIYFRYVSNSDNPQGKVKINFTSESQHVRAPYYIKGVTTADEFLSMLGKYQTTDVMFSSDYAVVVVSRTAALNYSIDTDKEKWLSDLDKILLTEDQISGLSDDDPNPLHRRLAKGIRHLFAEASSGYMFATDYGTGYSGDAPLVRLLTNLTASNNWGVAHELGHQHQQGAYKPSVFTEVSVNIYTEAVQRAFSGESYIRNSESAWNKLLNQYFTLPDETRDFFSNAIDTIAGSGNDSRLLLFEQLHMIFGDKFFHRLHRIVREEEIDGGNDDARKFYFVLKACQLTGYDLRSYFNKWGYKVLPYYQQVLDKAILDGGLQAPSCDISLTTPYSKPGCVPLPLIGITTSTPPSDPQPTDGAVAISKYCDYSSKSGDFTDSRDGKIYPYKRYGNYEWFTKNLDWDGYDGTNESSKGTVGTYGPGDADGKLYGRMYPTNAASSASGWCPNGWTVPTETLWNDLITSIKSTYNLTNANLVSCLKCGGGRDDNADGLWAKGPGGINITKAAEVGFNVLPGGVVNKSTLSYDNGDNPGLKASFLIPNSIWFHKVMSYADDSIAYTNRNSQHHASIRCVRQSPPASVQNVKDNKKSWIYIDDASNTLRIVSSEPFIHVNIMDASGKTIYDTKMPADTQFAVVSAQNWNRGIYIVNIQGAQGIEMHKAIKNF